MDILKLNNYLKSKNISVIEMAKDFGITKQALFFKLQGKRKFKADELCKIAIYTHMTSDEILDIFFDQQVNKCGNALPI